MLLLYSQTTSIEAEFLDEIQTKVLRVYLLAIHSHLYSFALRLFFLQTRATFSVSTVKLLYNVKEKGGNLIENHIPPSLSVKKSTQKSQV